MSSERQSGADPADAAADRVSGPQPASSFTRIVSTAQERSAERVELLRRRYEAIAQEQQRRWDDGVVMLNSQVRPILERALQACVEEGIPAFLEDNFSEQAATPRLMFYCSGPQPSDERRGICPESIKMVVEADGKCVRAGTAKSFSTFAEGMQVCTEVDETITGIFSAVLESYFQEYERAQVRLPVRDGTRDAQHGR